MLFSAPAAVLLVGNTRRSDAWEAAMTLYPLELMRTARKLLSIKLDVPLRDPCLPALHPVALCP